MEGERLDRFLDDATHAVADLWERRGGLALSLDDKYALNDALTQFFQGR